MPLVFETLLGKTVKVPEEVIREVITVELTNCFYWSCPNIDVDYSDVMEFLGGSRDPELLRRIARYILVYTENLVLPNYVYMKASMGSEKARAYLDSMKSLLMKLRRLYRILNMEPYGMYRELVDQMLQTCLDHGIDPF